MNRTMVDIEATGLNPKIDGLLQVAMVECYFNTNSKVWSPEHKVNVFFESTAYPKTLFAKKYQADLYRECREKGIEFKTGVSEVQDFLEGCEKDEDGRVVFMGWNASFFDLPFLVEKGVLVRPGRRFINRGRQKREIRI